MLVIVADGGAGGLGGMEESGTDVPILELLLTAPRGGFWIEGGACWMATGSSAAATPLFLIASIVIEALDIICS